MADLTIKVGAQVDEAIKSFENVSKKIGDISKQAEGFSSVGKIAFGSFVGTLTSQAILQGVNFLKDNVVDFFKESVKAAEDAETSLNDFNTSLALSGNYSKEASDKFQMFAEQIQKNTRFEDDAVIKNAALLESLTGLKEEGLEKAIGAAVELAARFKKDLPEAVEIIGRAFNGQTRGLEQLGIFYEKTGDKTKDFNTLLKIIQDRFSGSAKAEVDSYRGSIDQLKNAFGNFQEEIGKSWTDNSTIKTFIKGITVEIDLLSSAINKIREANKNAVDTRGSIFAPLGLSNITRKKESVSETLAKGGTDLGDFQSSYVDLSGSARKPLVPGKTDKEKALEDLNKSGASSGPRRSKEEVAAAEAAAKQKIDDAKKTAEAISKIENQVAQYGLEGTARIEEERKKKVNELVDAYGGAAKVFALNAIQHKNFIETKTKIDAEYAKKTQEERVKEYEAVQANYEAAAKQQKEAKEKLKKGIGLGLQSGIFGDEVDRSGFQTNNQLKEFDRNVAIGRGADLATSVLGGANGAKDLLVGGAQAVAEKILPGLGKAVGPILEALAQGPDAVKSFIRDFVKSVPILITNLVEAIPAVGEALVEQAPILIKSLGDKTPELIKSLTSQMPTVAISLAMQMPYIAYTLVTEIVKNIPYLVGQIGVGIYNAIVGLFNQVTGGISSAASSIGDFLGFAEGGYVKKVPNGFPNDSFPARLTEGEIVIDQSNAKKLENFLNSQTSNTDILNAILNAVSSPMTVNSDVKVNQQTFANIILELSRQNRRLA